MDEKTRMEYLRRMQEEMRAMTKDEIADMQKREAAGMMAADHMRGAAGMQNLWRIDEERPCIDLGRYAGTYGGTIEAEATRTLWQRLKRWAMRHNVQGDRREAKRNVRVG